MPGVGRRYASRTIAAGLIGAGAAMSLSWAAHATTGGGTGDPFATLTPVAASSLSNMRGGFFVHTPHGMFRFDFGVSIRLRARFHGPAGEHAFELTTNLTFNDHGKVSGVTTSSHGTLPGETTATVSTPGTTSSSSSGTSGTSGASGTSGTSANGDPVPLVAASTDKIGEGAGASVEIKNPNLNIVQQITKDNVTLINQIKSNNGSFSQEVVANVVAKNFSEILNSTVRSMPRINRINRQIGAFMAR
jgi:hypothetical protein